VDLPRLSWDAVCMRRLARHAVLVPSPMSPAGIVAGICGAHAQVMSAAELAIGLRGVETSRGDVRQSLWRDRSLVKTFGPRGTVHLLPAEDLATWCGALGARPTASGLPASARLDTDQLDAVLAAIEVALTDAELTADELDAAVVSACGRWAGDLVVPAFSGHWPRWRLALGRAANVGVLCFGPARGRRGTYTSPRRWVPGFEPADPEESLSWLVHRYLHAYGPATSAQFAQWLGAPRRWAEQTVAACSSRLEAVELDGQVAWVNAGDTEWGTASDADAVRGVRLLPYFDPYIVGSHPRARLFPPPMADRALSGGQAGTVPVLLVDGMVAGVWHQRRQGRGLHVTVEPLTGWDRARMTELEAEVDRVGRILDAVPELNIGAITVGRHA
jgi:hypothetical protein